jgi:hypothetical protein
MGFDSNGAQRILRERNDMRNNIRQRVKRAARTMCVLALAGISSNCVNRPLSPVAPTWETQMTAPVSLRSYTLADFVSKDSSFVGATPEGTQLAYGGHFVDTASIGDTSGTGKGHTLVDQETAADINSIKLHVVIDNAIPLKVALKLQMLDGANGLVLVIPQTAGDSITIPAPAVAGGTVQSPSHAERIIQLAGTEIQQFNSAYSLAYVLLMSTPGAGAVRFESTQTIRIRVWAEFSYQVNK